MTAIVIEGEEYPTVREAARLLGVRAAARRQHAPVIPRAESWIRD